MISCITVIFFNRFSIRNFTLLFTFVFFHNYLSNRPHVSMGYLTNKEASTVLCSVVKHAGSGRARKKCRGKHETKSSVFPHFLSALPLPACFTTEQSTVEASLFVL